MEFPRATYFLDISSVTKAFVRIPDVSISATGMTDSGAVELTFDGPTTVTVGARSLHTRPEATITVPDDPTALAAGRCPYSDPRSRSSPRALVADAPGYPPRIRVGDELDIPSPLVAPDTGIEVVVRPTYADVYRLSTLAYYLGARVVIGGRRRSDSTPATSSPCRPKVSRSKSASRSYSGRGSSSRHAGADGGVRQIRPIRVRTGGSEASVLPAETGRSVDERAADGVLRG